MFKLIAVMALVSTGCATIVGDKTQLISLNSSPDGATVLVRDERGMEISKGATPMTLTVKKGAGYFEGKDYTFLFSKEGYESQLVTLQSETNNWYLFGNFFFGGLIGWFIVDPVSGAMWKFDPDAISVSLVVSATTHPAAAQP